MMNKYRGRGATLLVILALIISCAITSSIADDVVGEKEQEPNVAERAMGFIDPLNRWEKLKIWTKLGWLNYGPSEKTEKPQSNVGDVVKEAVAKSYETSKGTAENAAKYTGDAVHNTAEKVKRTVSSFGNENLGAEL